MRVTKQERLVIESPLNIMTQKTEEKIYKAILIAMTIFSLTATGFAIIKEL